MNNLKTYKFRGGVRIGAWANSWPFGLFKVTRDALVLRDVMLGKEIEFSKENIDCIEIKKIFPIIGYGIQIRSKIENQNDAYIFWYVGFHFQKFIDSLKEFNYL